MIPLILTVIPLAAALLAPHALFDKVLLKDGRTIEGTIIPSPDPAYTRVKLPGAEVPINNSLIDKTYVENLAGYEPKNKQEEDYLKKGWVLFEGAWMSKDRREGELRKRAEADKAAIEAVKHRQNWRNAVTRDTRHFIVKSNLDDATLGVYIERLENYYKAFVDFWGISLSPGDKKGKPRVFLYRSPEDFHKITGVPFYVGGFFSPGELELHLPHNTEDPEEAMDVLYHEGNHLLTFLISPDFWYPIWISEGMAEYYGTAEMDGKGNFVVGAQQGGRIVGMRWEKQQGKFRSLRDVLLTEKPEFNAYHYAYAWSFVHFLMQSPKYGKVFKGFYGNLADNKDLHITKTNDILGYGRQAIGTAELPDLLTALEKRLGKTIDELEQEWLEYFDQAYKELRPDDYYLAAQIALNANPPPEDGSNVKQAIEFYDKAVALGIKNANCYRSYAELLRKGGVMELSEVNLAVKPDPVKAWDMIQKAIELDPIQPVMYAEAAGILILDGPIQDLERAQALAETAIALAGPRDTVVKALYDELMALIEPAREARRAKAQADAELAASDRRNWFVAPFFVQGQPEPPRIENLTTQQLRELIRAGKVSAKDHVYQSWFDLDPDGQPIMGQNAWDTGWVALSDVPVFAEDLAAVAAGAGQPAAPAAPSAPGASGTTPGG